MLCTETFVGGSGALLGLGYGNAYYVSTGVGQCGGTGKLTVPISFRLRAGDVES